VASVVAELELLQKSYKISFVDIVDWTFTYDRRYVEEFCNTLIERGLKVNWRCTARFDSIDRGLLELMKRANCAGLYFGLESGSNRILKSIDEKMTVEQMVEASKMVHDSGINMAASVLLGLPDEGREEMEATLKLMKRVRTEIIDVNSFIPLPGAPLYDRMSKEEQRSIDSRKVGLKSFDNYFSRRMSHEEFKSYLSEAYKIANSRRKRTMVRFGLERLFGPVSGAFKR
jgi:radical SAM superfamily enzyme YgiQ (UPF0313 family)